eukprot:7043369-Pyramimonas_sp.AAC.1
MEQVLQDERKRQLEQHEDRKVKRQKNKGKKENTEGAAEDGGGADPKEFTVQGGHRKRLDATLSKVTEAQLAIAGTMAEADRPENK